MKNPIITLKNNNRGAAAIIIALALPVLIGMLLLAINLTNEQGSDINTKGAADSGVLSAAQYITQTSVANGVLPNGVYTSGPIYQAALTGFTGNANNDEGMTLFNPASVKVTLESDPAVPNGQRVRIYGCHFTDNNFNIKNKAEQRKQVCNESVANIGRLSGEIVFAVDVSASMKQPVAGLGPKITLLQNAVTDVINDQLLKAKASGGVIEGVWWGLVPFRGMVDLGNYSTFVPYNFTPISGGQLKNEKAIVDTLLTKANLSQTASHPVGDAIINQGNKLRRIAVTKTAADFTDDPNHALNGYWEHDKDFSFYTEGEMACDGSVNYPMLVAPKPPAQCSTWKAEDSLTTLELTKSNLCKTECKLFRVHDGKCGCDAVGPNIFCNCGIGYRAPVYACGGHGPGPKPTGPVHSGAPSGGGGGGGGPGGGGGVGGGAG